MSDDDLAALNEYRYFSLHALNLGKNESKNCKRLPRRTNLVI